MRHCNSALGSKEGPDKRLIVHKPLVAPNTTDGKLIPLRVDECASTAWAIGIWHEDIVAAAI